MNAMFDYKRAFGGLVDQLHYQETFGSLPESEAGVVLMLALGMIRSGAVDETDIVLEKRVDRGQRVDLWMPSTNTGIEVKFFRPIPSGGKPSFTKRLGSLLADANKLASSGFAQCWLLLASDATSVNYLARRGGSWLSQDLQPSGVSKAPRRLVDNEVLSRLPPTARCKATEHAPWVPLATVLRGTASVDELYLRFWEVSLRGPNGPDRPDSC